MTKLNHSEQMLAEKTVCILLVCGEVEDGTSIYAYTAVRADKLEEFMIAQQTDSFYPEDYGVIIETGAGYPSEQVQKKMETDYGFNHEMIVDIPDSDEAGDLMQKIVSADEENTTD